MRRTIARGSHSSKWLLSLGLGCCEDAGAGLAGAVRTGCASLPVPLVVEATGWTIAEGAAAGAGSTVGPLTLAAGRTDGSTASLDAAAADDAAAGAVVARAEASGGGRVGGRPHREDDAGDRPHAEQHGDGHPEQTAARQPGDGPHALLLRGECAAGRRGGRRSRCGGGWGRAIPGQLDRRPRGRDVLALYDRDALHVARDRRGHVGRERGDERGDRRVPAGRLSLEALHHDGHEPGREVRAVRLERDRRVVRDARDDLVDRLRLERRHAGAGQQLVEDDAERPHVAPPVDVPRRAHLLRRHVERRAEHLAGLGSAWSSGPSSFETPKSSTFTSGSSDGPGSGTGWRA